KKGYITSPGGPGAFAPPRPPAFRNDFPPHTRTGWKTNAGTHASPRDSVPSHKVVQRRPEVGIPERVAPVERGLRHHPPARQELCGELAEDQAKGERRRRKDREPA